MAVTFHDARSDILAGFRRFGAIADLLELDEDIKLLWQLPLRYLHDAIEPARVSAQEPDEPLDSTFAYVTNGEFNAAIRHEERAAAACIFVGVPIVALRACRQLALSLDRRTGLPLADERGRIVAFDDRLPIESEWAITDDPARQAWRDLDRLEASIPATNNDLATFLFDIAMRYVAAHEAMHFVLGHARFCQRVLGLDVFADASERRRDLDPVTSQTLEFIADRHTVAGVWADLRHGRLYHEWCTELPPGVEVDAAVWRRRLLIATLTLISKLWKGHGSQSFADFSAPYPHPYERVLWMVSGLIEMSDDADRGDIEDCFARNVAALDRNFSTRVVYEPLIERDMQAFRAGRASPLDRGYTVVRAKAMEIQRRLLQEHGPFYPSA